MSQKTCYLFAGQGSQYIGMGKDLYGAFAESKTVFDKADKALGVALSKICFEGPLEELTRTANCQPAILTVSIAALEAFRSRRQAPGSSPDYAAGLSLGEYSALVAAGALGFEDALYLVRRRGELMEEAALKNPGRMLSLIGLDLAKVKEICLESESEIANLNCPGQIVISGSVQAIEQAKKLAESAGAKMALILEVSGAFHSSLMQEAALKLAGEIEKIKINPPQLPVISNVTAKAVGSAAEIKENLVKQVSSSVLWEDSMRFILGQGIKNFIEFGPGKVLRGLMRRIDPGAQVVNVEKESDIIVLQQGLSPNRD